MEDNKVKGFAESNEEKVQGFDATPSKAKKSGPTLDEIYETFYRNLQEHPVEAEEQQNAKAKEEKK